MPPTKKPTGSVAKRKAESDVSSSATAKRSKANASFPGKIGKSLTLAQLREEAEARGMDLGNVKHDKAFLVGALGEGSLSVVALSKKQRATGPSPSKKPITSAVAPKKKEPAKTGSKVSKAVTAKAKLTTAKTPPNGTTKRTDKAKSTPTKVKSSTTTAASKLPTKKLNQSKTSVSAAKKTNSAASKKAPPRAQTSLPNAPTADPKPAKITSSASTAAKSLKTSTSKNNASTSASTKGTNRDDYPRITNKLTLAQLREEAVARQLDPKHVPKLKAELLHHLVDGSIHIKETKTYKEYQDLLKKLDGEKAKLYMESLKQKKAADAKKEAQRLEKQRKYEKEQKEEERRRLQIRNEEKARQKCLHSHSFPQVHCHPLAETDRLLLRGGPRRGVCDLCDTGRAPSGALLFSFEPPARALYTCEECDWDICRDCFDLENKSDAEKKRIRLAHQKRAEAARKMAEAEERRREEEMRHRWDAHERFKASIIKPAAKHKKLSTKLKYTVWCSDGYDNDGWHSYEGEPTKEFDTVWATKKEANDRAEYLFFWKNPWGISPNQLTDYDSLGEDLSPRSHDGMNKWSAAPADSSRWTVGVVPAAAYMHLENASQNRHNYDDGYEPNGYEEEEPVFLF